MFIIFELMYLFNSCIYYYSIHVFLFNSCIHYFLIHVFIIFEYMYLLRLTIKGGWCTFFFPGVFGEKNHN